jgi:HSP20 family protein
MAGTLAKKSTGMFPWLERGPLGALRHEMDDLMERFFGEDRDGFFPTRGLPSIDVSETDNAVEVKMDLPGVKPDEVNVEVRDNVLTVSGERKEEKESEEGNGRKYHRVERRYGSFSRSVRLPTPIDENKVNAEYRDGVLSITLPKTEEAKTRKIKVKG